MSLLAYNIIAALWVVVFYATPQDKYTASLIYEQTGQILMMFSMGNLLPYWRVSEVSETLLVVVQWKTRFVYTYVCETQNYLWREQYIMQAETSIDNF